MQRGSKSFAIYGLVGLVACSPARPPAAPPAGPGGGAAEDRVQNLIIMVADGAGIAYWSAARLAGARAVEQMPVVGLIATQSASDYVTDSAASATAYATGVRTYNYALGVGPRCGELLRQDSAAAMRAPAACDPRENVFEIARRNGMATGVVTTTYVTDATPGAFLVHVPHREMYGEIARQIAAGGAEVVLGGGTRHFERAEDDGQLLERLCAAAVCLSTPEDLARYRPDDRRLIGLFAPTRMPPAGERDPTLPEMVSVALARLSRDPDGFVALFETEATDDVGHGGEPLPRVVAEMREFDRAVQVALEFARTRPGTLIVVTADHDTGGLALAQRADTLAAAYIEDSLFGHTGEMVPIFAIGPAAERFGGIHDNDEIGRILKELVSRR